MQHTHTQNTQNVGKLMTKKNIYSLRSLVKMY